MCPRKVSTARRHVRRHVCQQQMSPQKHPIDLHVIPLERSIIFIRCLSHCLFFSLLFLLLFFLWESSLEVLDNSFFFLFFRSIALSLLMKVTLSGCWLLHVQAHKALDGLAHIIPHAPQSEAKLLEQEVCSDGNALYLHWAGITLVCPADLNELHIQ